MTLGAALGKLAEISNWQVEERLREFLYAGGKPESLDEDNPLLVKYTEQCEETAEAYDGDMTETFGATEMNDLNSRLSKAKTVQEREQIIAETFAKGDVI